MIRTFQFVLFLCFSNTVFSQLNLYVALNGNDNSTGTINSPLASLEGARDKIRAIKSTTGLPAGGIEVLIRKGTYTLMGSFELSAEDSGTSSAPIVYASYQGEEVIIQMGRTLPTHLWTSLSSDALQRAHPQVDTEKLVELDYTDLGLLSSSSFTTSITEQTNSPDGIFLLFANGERQQLSIWPNPNENITGYNDPGWATPNGTRDNSSFYYAEGGQPTNEDFTNELDFDSTNRSARWKTRLDEGYEIWLRGHWRTPWGPYFMLVDGMNTEESWISFSTIPQGGMGSKYVGQFVSYDGKPYRRGSGEETFHASNMLEEIDMPGEYAVNYTDKKIYFFPPANMNELELSVADKSSSIFVLNEVDHIQIKRLTLKKSAQHGIDILNCNYIGVYGCDISGVGKRGVTVNGGSNYTLQSNDLYNTGETGLWFTPGDDYANLISGNSIVTNNHVYNTGQLGSAFGMYIGDVVRNTFSHNLVHHTASGGIMHVQDFECLYEYNEVHNTALKSSDTGGFYTTLNWTTYGNLFRYNFIHHNARANGFYCDDGDSGDTYRYNIVHNSWNPLKFGGGHDNIGENNLLIKNGQARIDDRGLSRGYTAESSKYGGRVTSINPFQEPWLSFGERMEDEYDLTTDLWGDKLDPDWMPECPHGSRYKDNVTVESNSWRLPQLLCRENIVFEGNEEAGPVDSVGFYNYDQMDLRSDNNTILSKFPDLNTAFPKMGLIVDEYRSFVPSRESVGGLKNGSEASGSGEDLDLFRYIHTDQNSSAYQYDFGTEESSFPEDWLKLDPQIRGNVFWRGDQISAVDFGEEDDEELEDLTKDIIQGTGTTSFNHRVTKGTWRVELVIGDCIAALSGIKVVAEGNVINDNLATNAGAFKYVNEQGGSESPSYFEIEVTDRWLNIELSSSANKWAISHIKLIRVKADIEVDINQTVFHYDFGPVGSETNSGWQVLSPDDYGDVYWSGDELTTQDQGLGTGVSNLTRDFVQSTGIVNLNHKLSNGIWRVELVMGEKDRNHWGMIIGAEGAARTYGITTAASEFKYVGDGTSSVTPTYFDVLVTDGELNLQFRKLATPPWVANHLKLSKIADEAVVNHDRSFYKYDFGTHQMVTPIGWQSVSPNDYGDISWSGEALAAYDQNYGSGADHLTRDFVGAVGQVDFNHKLTTGKWRVEMVMGNKEFDMSGITVSAEGELVASDISVNAGEFKYINVEGGRLTHNSYFDVLVEDGELNINIHSANLWALNHLTLTKIGREVTLPPDATSYQLDFGSFDSTVEEGWTRICNGDYGDVSWTGNNVSIFSRENYKAAGITDLTRDEIFGTGAWTYNQQIANGNWRVEVVLGSMLTNYWGMQVKAEDLYILGGISTGKADFRYVGRDSTSVYTNPIYFDIEVTDGELNIEFTNSGGRGWVTNHMKLIKLIDSDGDNIFDHEDLCPNINNNSGNCELECQSNLVETNNTFLQSSNIQVADYIESNGILTSGKNLSYQAGKYIKLSNGFEVKQGADFEAAIDGCLE